MSDELTDELRFELLRILPRPANPFWACHTCGRFMHKISFGNNTGICAHCNTPTIACPPDKAFVQSAQDVAFFDALNRTVIGLAVNSTGTLMRDCGFEFTLSPYRLNLKQIDRKNRRLLAMSPLRPGQSLSRGRFVVRVVMSVRQTGVFEASTLQVAAPAKSKPTRKRTAKKPKAAVESAQLATKAAH